MFIPTILILTVTNLQCLLLTVLSHLLHSPAVMGNLWPVAANDIDNLTSQLLSQWMSQKKPTSLGQLLMLARKSCLLHGLTGFAPVVYGLPVMMN